MKFTVPILALGVLSAALEQRSVPGQFENCGAGVDSLSFSSIVLNPFPIVSGEEFEVKVQGTLSAPITEGAELKIVLKKGILPVQKKTHNACLVFSNRSSESCPIQAGHISMTTKVIVPKLVPGGGYNVEVVMTNADGSEIMCSKGKIEIVKH